MQLNDILKKNTLRAISRMTKISEENIECLSVEDFQGMSKAKTLGFISIIERDYNADLSALRENALSYYAANDNEPSIGLGLPNIEEKKRRSKWTLFIILALLVYASWYFFTQFDQKTLGSMLHFTGDKMEIQDVKVQEDTEEALSIKDALESKQRDTTVLVEPVITTKSITIIPEAKLWFGTIDMATGKRDHFSISEKYEIDVEEKSWLLATSSAPFSFISKDEVQEFNDAKEHYFKIDKEGITLLSKSAYVKQGGWQKW